MDVDLLFLLPRCVVFDDRIYVACKLTPLSSYKSLSNHCRTRQVDYHGDHSVTAIADPLTGLSFWTNTRSKDTNTE